MRPAAWRGETDGKMFASALSIRQAAPVESSENRFIPLYRCGDTVAWLNNCSAPLQQI